MAYLYVGDAMTTMVYLSTWAKPLNLALDGIGIQDMIDACYLVALAASGEAKLPEHGDNFGSYTDIEVAAAKVRDLIDKRD